MTVTGRKVLHLMMALALLAGRGASAECGFFPVTAGDGKDDGFGGAVSLSADGSMAIIGEAGHDGPAGPYAGIAYVFVHDGTAWVQRADLVPADSEPYQQFGWAVDISADGRTVVVGAESDDYVAFNAGAAYVFIRDGESWSQQAKLVAADPTHSAYFGFAVAVSAGGDTALIGARFDGEMGQIAGAAYVFAREGSQWTQQDKLTASDAAPEREFGYTVDLSGDGDTAFVGAPGANAVYEFKRTGEVWTERAKITPAAYPRNSFFFGWGLAVTAKADAVLVSMCCTDSFVFARDGDLWTQGARLQGSYVAVSGDGTRAITGEWQGDTAFVHVRAGSEWHQVQMASPDAASFSYFGANSDLSADGTTALIGAPGGPGTAYFVGFACDADLDDDGAVGIVDFLTLLSAWGSCPPTCPADLDGDSAVGIADFQLLLVNWSH
jgi:hypothetical protein